MNVPAKGDSLSCEIRDWLQIGKLLQMGDSSASKIDMV